MAVFIDWYPGDHLVELMLNMVVAVAIISMLGIGLTKCMKRHPATRHSILLSALICVLATPLFTATLGTWQVSFFEVPLFDHPEIVDAPAAMDASIFHPEIVAPFPQLKPPYEPEVYQSPPEPPLSFPEENVSVAPGRQPKTLAVSAPQQIQIKTLWNTRVRHSATAIALVWSAGSLVLLLWLARSWYRLIGVYRSLQYQTESGLHDALNDACQVVGGRRLPRIAVSEHVHTPIATGLFRPLIVLPEKLRDVLTSAALRDVLVHEMAHLVRKDQLVVLLQAIAKVLFWPIWPIHLLNRRLSDAREEVCDNFVLTQRDAVDYSETLLRVAQMSHNRVPSIAPTGILGWHGRLEDRITDLIHESRSISTQINRFAAASILAATVLATGFFCGISIVAADDPISSPQKASAGHGKPTPLKQLAGQIQAVMPNWKLHKVDKQPTVILNGDRGYHLVLRRSWKHYLEASLQQLATAQREGPFEMRHTDWEFVLFPLQTRKKPATLMAQINWQRSKSPWHTRNIWMGQGHGYSWFTHSTIFDQEFVRDKLSLSGGDDRIRLAIDGMMIEDEGTMTGTMTGTSCLAIPAKFGNRSLPYVRKILEQSKRNDLWRVVGCLRFIRSQQSTDLLLDLFDSDNDNIQRAAQYALIHKPYRKLAKRAYFDMLRRQSSFEYATEACVEFNWKDSLPILRRVIATPENFRRLQTAIHTRRTLEGNPVAQEILDAERTLQRVSIRNRDPVLTNKILFARNLLIQSDDTEAANLAALALSRFSTKGISLPVRTMGIEILKLRPRPPTLKFLKLHKYEGLLKQIDVKSSDKQNARDVSGRTNSYQGPDSIENNSASPYQSVRLGANEGSVNRIANSPYRTQVDSSLAWQSTDNYIAPNFEKYFPDDEEGGKKLDALYAAADKDSRSDEEILKTVRNGLRRTSNYRSKILSWIGKRYIWNKTPQNPDAIELMYHAADFSEPKAESYETRSAAVYYGLSVVKSKTPAILRTLVELCMPADHANDIGRVAWGAASQRAELLSHLAPHLKSKDETVRKKALVLEKIFKGELEAVAWAKEHRRKQAKAKYTDQLPAIKAELINGNSEVRREVLELIRREGIIRIMDDSFIGAFATCAEDEDSIVRGRVATIVGTFWVWEADTANRDAIKLMLRMSHDEDKTVSGNAVYYGLLPLNQKDDAVTRRLQEMEAKDVAIKMAIQGLFELIEQSGKVALDKNGNITSLHLTGKSDLDRVTITSEQIEMIAKLEDLNTLSLDFTTVDDDDIRKLSSLKKLQLISLNYTGVTGESLESLSLLKNLFHVSLVACDVQNEHLAALIKMPSVGELRLRLTKVTDAGLKHLRERKKLYLLHLDDCQITDAGLASLGDLPDIRSLSLSKTIRYSDDKQSALTDKCVDYLISLETLRDLTISDSQLTEEGLQRLRDGLPKAKVSTESFGITYRDRKRPNPGKK